MPREFPRARRVEEQLKRLLAEQIRREVKDPRVGLITITAVEVSRDLTHARVLFTPFAGVGDPGAALEALRHAAGFLRHQIRKEMRLRVAPELVFEVDDSIERAARLTSLIHEAVEGDRRQSVERDPDAE
jgi:ribosome-binding factor A